MLKESLEETLEAAKFCTYYKKTATQWGEFQTGGCLGYPAAILLFSLVDTIGSYYRKNFSFKINLDGKSVSINSDGWEHFKILNSKYFKQILSTSYIKALYNKFRSSLTHNSVLGKDTIMYPNEINYPNPAYNSKAFATGKDQNGNLIHLLSIRELYLLCEEAVRMFKADIDSIVPHSKQGKNFH